MKKLFTAILITSFLSSCKQDDTKLTEMKSPVRVLAVQKDSYLVVIDSTGRVETLVNSGTATLLAGQFQVGDTIK